MNLQKNLISVSSHLIEESLGREELKLFSEEEGREDGWEEMEDHKGRVS